MRGMNHPLKEKIYAKFPTVDAFCSVSGIDRSTVYCIMRGRTKMPNGFTIYRIADTLNLTYQQVVDMLESSDVVR